MNSVCIDCERCSQFIGGLSSIFGLVIKTVKKMRKVAEGAVWHEETVDVPVGTYVISVANLPNGFYQLILTTEEGMTWTITFVKQ